jgi:hypothetical protein
MRRQSYRLSTALGVLVVVASVAAGSMSDRTPVPEPPSQCLCQDAAPPQALRGTLHQADYAFAHTSDVETGAPNRFSNILLNVTPDTIFRWHRDW